MSSILIVEMSTDRYLVGVKESPTLTHIDLTRAEMIRTVARFTQKGYQLTEKYSARVYNTALHQELADRLRNCYS